MDRFRALEALVAVADSCGFAPAAEKLRMSPTAVTRIIAALEDHVGARLFARTTRRVRLTEAGERFVVEAQKILADLAEAEAAVSGAAQALKGRIRITAPVLFGRSHVAPPILDFMQQYPEIAVDLILADRTTDLLEENIDLAVRIGDLADSTLTATRVGSVRRMLCASPDYVARCGAPDTLAALEALDGIDLVSASSRQWTFRQNGADRTVRPRIVLSTNSPEVVISACVRGLGVARFMTYQVSEEIDAGRLVPLLETSPVPVQPVHLIYPAQKQLGRRVRLLLDHLTVVLRENQFS